MKPNLKSRLFNASAVAAGIGAFLAGIQFAPAGMFEPWVTFVAGCLILGLNAWAMALRGNDYRNEFRGQRVREVMSEIAAEAPELVRVTEKKADPVDPMLDQRKAHRPLKPSEIKRRQQQLGYATFDGLQLSAVVSTVVIGLIVLVVCLLNGCTTAWSGTPCEVDKRGEVNCAPHSAKVRILAHPTLPRPAGRFIIEADGKKLPITIDADNVNLPKSQTRCEVE